MHICMFVQMLRVYLRMEMRVCDYKYVCMYLSTCTFYRMSVMSYS